MIYQKINCVYFSATGTTRTTVSLICKGLGIADIQELDLFKNPQTTANIPSSEITIFGVPVYSGRVPSIAVERLKNIKGNNTPAIIACVYGNRDFDDALAELRDIVESNGFIVISAGAFIAQHSIFPQVASGRPDADDMQKIINFGKQSFEQLSSNTDLIMTTNPSLTIKGNNPYGEVKKIPLKPKVNRHCNKCGLCAKQCPTQAIDTKHPRKTDGKRCIACAHCIAICPQNARHFGGLLYSIASRIFRKKCAVRREPYTVYKKTNN